MSQYVYPKFDPDDEREVRLVSETELTEEESR